MACHHLSEIPRGLHRVYHGQAMMVLRWINTLLAASILLGVWLYRFTLGWAMGGQCRYQPTCSQYMLDAVAKHGPWRGGWRGIKRIGRCHPWGGSGYDPP